jgi:Sulfotransferase family
MISETEKVGDSGNVVAGRRSAAPVFVVGCPRSGTTVLYHMLLSAGGFAVYRSESNVFNLLVPRFGGMRTLRDRERLMAEWRNSILCDVAGLNADGITAQVIEQCRNGGDFLRIVMGEVARSQGVHRWADCTPEHLLYMEEIKREIPDALFIHIIRDGRDVALSYSKQGWAHPMPWDHGQQLGVAALYWSWIVGRGRESGRRLDASYQEVRFEELVTHPRETLARLGRFIDQDLNYEAIQRAGIGSVSRPNTSFHDSGGEFHPVERWRTKMSTKQVTDLEALVGDRLEQLGYPLATPYREFSWHVLRMRSAYFTMFHTKQWMKSHTRLGRRVKLERIHPQRGPSQRVSSQ